MTYDARHWHDMDVAGHVDDMIVGGLDMNGAWSGDAETALDGLDKSIHGGGESHEFAAAAPGELAHDVDIFSQAVSGMTEVGVDAACHLVGGTKRKTFVGGAAIRHHDGAFGVQPGDVCESMAKPRVVPARGAPWFAGLPIVVWNAIRWWMYLIESRMLVNLTSSTP